MWIVLFESHNNPMSKVFSSHFLDEETGSEGYISLPKEAEYESVI